MLFSLIPLGQLLFGNSVTGPLPCGGHKASPHTLSIVQITVKILKFGTLQTIAIIVLKIEKFDVTLH